MSLQQPTTQEINDGILAQLSAALNQTIPLLAKAFLRVLSKTLAGVFVLLYKYAGFTFLQMFVQTASNSETEVNGETITPLVLWGTLIGVGPPVPATASELEIDITVENQVGSLDSGTQLVNSGNGVTYVTIGAVLLDAATVSATIRAVADQNDGGGVGSIGNLDPGAVVSFANPIANVARDAVVTAQTVTGADAESTETYRQRVVARWQQRPQGGALVDYRVWGEEVSGIVAVFPYTGDVPGTVQVYSEATEASSGSPDGIPTAAQLIAVFDAIEFDDNGVASRRPANAAVFSLAITRKSFDVTVSGIAGVPDLPATELAVTAAIEEYFRAAEPFIDGLTVLPRTDTITKTTLTSIVNEVVAAVGGTFLSASFHVTGTPADLDTYILLQGEKAKAFSVVFV